MCMLQNGMLLLQCVIIKGFFAIVTALVRERSTVQSCPAAPEPLDFIDYFFVFWQVVALYIGVLLLRRIFE